MKRVEESSSSRPSLFVGVCKTCGEIYEAKSALEDLEGVTFKCKKLLCDGRVSLASSASTPDSIADEGVSPKRFC